MQTTTAVTTTSATTATTKVTTTSTTIATTKATTKATTNATTRATTKTTTKATTKATEPSPEQLKAEYIDSCDDGFEYEDVERYPDDYDGKRLAIYGWVVQVLEYKDQAVETSVWEKWIGNHQSKDNSLNNVTYGIDDYMGNRWYVTYVREKGETRILEDDYVAIYGVCQGVKTYSMTNGSYETFPTLDVKYIEIWVEP